MFKKNVFSFEQVFDRIVVFSSPFREDLRNSMRHDFNLKEIDNSLIRRPLNGDGYHDFIENLFGRNELRAKMKDKESSKDPQWT